MNSKLSKTILERIEREKIEPKSKWIFFAKNYLFWFFVFLSVVALSFLFVALFSHFYYLDFQVADRVSGGKIRHFFLFFPYALFLFLSLFLIITLENILHTKYAYRISLKKIFSAIFIGSLILSGGIILFIKPEKIESQLEKVSMGMYHSGNFRRKQMWVQPQKGLIAGTLLSYIEGDDFVDFVDFSGKTWVLDISGFDERERKALSLSDYLALQGEVSPEDDTLFIVCAFKEWFPRGMLWRKNERNVILHRSNKCH